MNVLRYRVAAIIITIKTKMVIMNTNGIKFLVYGLGVILCCFSSCRDSEENGDMEEEMELGPSILGDVDFVSGVRFFDPIGVPITEWRTANDKSIQGTLYPNPAVDQIILSHPDTIIAIWFVDAVCGADSTYANFESIMDTVSFTREEVDDISVLKLTSEVPVAPNLGLSLTSLDVGLYKVFWQLDDGTIEWQNVYKGSNPELSDAQSALNTSCQ